MNNILVICGPTAAGKTETGIKLAKEYNGELISADSRQVYKDMDIGTGKDIPKNAQFVTCHSERSEESHNLCHYNTYSLGYYLLKNTPLWLLDIVSPDQPFSVAEYQKLAWMVIKDVWSRGKLPILVGGTGLYLKAVIDGIETVDIPPDDNLRLKLASYSLKELQEKLQKLNSEKWESLNNSDLNNPRRLVRAIEIILWGKINKTNKSNKTNTAFDTLFIGLTAPNDFLYHQIDKRVEKRVKEGIINEVKNLLNKGYSWNLPSMSGLGYRVWKDYFENKKTLEQTTQRWKYDEHGFARRQITWFKKDKRIKWFDIGDVKTPLAIRKEVKNWLAF